MIRALLVIGVMGPLVNSAHAKSGSLMAPYERFKTWSEPKKRTYLHDVRGAVVDLEKGWAENYELASGDGWRSLFPSLIDEAYAARGSCLVGGVERSLVRKGKRWVCPTSGRGCGSLGASGYECGKINNSACVPRLPLATLSERCGEAAGDQLPSREQYDAMKAQLQSISDACRDNRIDRRFRGHCERFKNRLSQLQDAYAPGPNPVAPPTPGPQPVAPAPGPGPGGAATPGPTGPPAPAPAEPGPPPAPGPGGAPAPAPADAPEPGPGGGATPPAPGTRPEAVSPQPPGATPPSTAGMDEECKALYGMVIEGTDDEKGASNPAFHESAAKWAEAYGALATYTSVIPPPGPVTHALLPKDPGQLDKVKEAIGRANGKEELCSGEAPDLFIPYAFGRDLAPTPVQGLGDYRNGLRKAVDGKRVALEKVDVTQDTGVQKTALMERVNALKQKCGNKADQVVMITIKDHGGADCNIAMGPRSKSMDPEDMKKKIIDPLAATGAKVVINFDACYSGCFVEKLKPMLQGTNVCLTSTTRASTVGYGADKVIREGTYDSTYPEFLGRTKNPLKAHLCASAYDPLNGPKVDGNSAVTRSAAPKVDLSAKRADVLKRVGEKFGMGDLARECHHAPFKYVDVPGADEGKVKDLFTCQKVREAFTAALGKEETDTLLADLSNQTTAPGIEALEQLLKNEGEIAGAKSACDIDLGKYAAPATPGAAGAAPVTATPGVSK